MRTQKEAVPRLVRIAALIGGAAAIPVALVGCFLAGDLLAVAVTRVFGDNALGDQLSAGAVVAGTLGFAACVLLGGT